VAFFRTITTTLLLGVVAARVLSQGAENFSTGDVTSFGLITFVYVLTLVYAALLRAGVVGQRSAWGQVLGDVVLASALVFQTGGVYSPFAFVYSLAIIEASILLFRRGAIVTAAVSSTVLVAIIFALRQLSAVPEANVPRLAVEVTIHVVAQFLIAALSGFVAEQLTRTGGRLVASEQELRQAVDLQNRIVAAMPSGLITCDAQGLVTFTNPAAQAILGLDDDPRGRARLEELIPGVDHARSQLRQFELQVSTRAGDRTLGLTVTSLDVAKGSILVVFQDLTELRRLQNELNHIDRLASLGRLSAQLAHEVRNPLASMRGSAQMLATDAQPGGPEQRLARLIMRESDRLAALVDSYLELARPQPPRLQPQDLKGVISETLDMLRADPLVASTTVETALHPAPAVVDEGQLKQVFINLLRNAVTAAGPHGTVKVTVGQSEQGEPQITVWDSAGAISTADQARIFEPFFTTRPGGTGLGLSTAQAIVQAHGGTIEVSSSPQAGTTFTVRLVAAPVQGAARDGAR
jgi:two-component system sensor histidine kinase PilS (NtrC family)